MGVQTFTKWFNKLNLFALDHMSINALRVSHFRYAMRDDLRMMCHTCRTQTYTELINLVIRVMVDQKDIRNYSTSQGGFRQGQGAFRGRGTHIVLLYDPLY